MPAPPPDPPEGRQEPTSAPTLVLPGAPPVTAREWRWVGAVAAALLAITSVPYLFAHLAAPGDRRFMGIMLDVPDHAQYFSWLRELGHRFLAANKMTPEPNPEAFFNLLWWLLGRLAAVFGLDAAAAFQVLRWGGGALFLFVLYRVLSGFVDDPAERRMAFLLATLGAGFGWILIVAKYGLGLAEAPAPLLVYTAEPNTFLCLFAYPHFLAAGVYPLAFDLVLRDPGRVSRAMLAGLVALVVGWQHAYDLIQIWSVLGAWALALLVRERRIPWALVRSIAIVVGISVWPALYSVLLVRTQPVWRAALAQFGNAGVFTPPPWQLPVLLGPVFLVALLGPWRERAGAGDDRVLLLRVWLATNLLLLYVPADFQIHMLNGIQVPAAVLAARALRLRVAPALARWRGTRGRLSPARARLVAGVLLLAVAVPTNAYLYAWRFVDLGRFDYPFFLRADDVAALDWLESNVEPDDVVLASLTIGQFVPARTGAHAYLAHWAQTLDFFARRDRVAEVYDAATPTPRRSAILAADDVDFVFRGAAEARLGAARLELAPELRCVFASGGTRVYAASASSRERLAGSSCP